MGIARRLTLVAALALAAAGSVPAPALAGPPAPNCGDTITADTTLTADLDCSGSYWTGLFIGADNITLDLGGHTIWGTPNYDYVTGVDLEGHRKVIIKNGSIQDFYVGISLSAAVRARVKHLDLVGDGDLYSTGVNVSTGVSNTLTKLDISGFYYGIYIQESATNMVTWNTISGANYSIYASQSTRDTVSYNTSEGLPGQTYGLYDYASYAQTYSYNTFKDGAVGAEVDCYSSTYVNLVGNQALDNSGNGFYMYNCVDQRDRGSLVQDNVASRNGDNGFYAAYPRSNTWIGNVAKSNTNSGFYLDYPSNTTIRHNTGNHNGGDGIHLANNGVPYEVADFSFNEANSNDVNGIEADFLIVVGSGNHAKLNAGTNCINVACSL